MIRALKICSDSAALIEEFNNLFFSVKRVFNHFINDNTINMLNRLSDKSILSNSVKTKRDNLILVSFYHTLYVSNKLNF